jgi:hypothetical protein
MPQYNLRFFFPHLVQEALKGLNKDSWEDWYRPYCEAHKLTEDDLAAAWKGYAAYAQSCLDSPDQDGPLDALMVSGFTSCRPEAQLIVLAKIGQLLTASLWFPLREGTHLGETPEDFLRLVKQSEGVAANLRAAP